LITKIIVNNNISQKEKRLNNHQKQKVKMPYKMYMGIKKSVTNKYKKNQEEYKTVKI
jgi:hypothetical protein